MSQQQSARITQLEQQNSHLHFQLNSRQSNTGFVLQEFSSYLQKEERAELEKVPERKISISL